MMLKSSRDRQNGVYLKLCFSFPGSAEERYHSSRCTWSVPRDDKTDSLLPFTEPNGAFLCMEGNRPSIVTQSADFEN
jgi:hypothetical protein